MTVNILDAASDDIYDGYCFYEKRQPGLGVYFYEAVKDEIASLRTFAGIHLMVGQCHRLIMKRFPYSIYYVLDRAAAAATVLAVVGDRRDPTYLTIRLGGLI